MPTVLTPGTRGSRVEGSASRPGPADRNWIVLLAEDGRDEHNAASDLRLIVLAFHELLMRRRRT